MSQWIDNLQKCFGMLFKGCIDLYIESTNVEKVKNHLINTIEMVKGKTNQLNKQNEELKNDNKNLREVLLTVITRCKCKCQ